MCKGTCQWGETAGRGSSNRSRLAHERDKRKHAPPSAATLRRRRPRYVLTAFSLRRRRRVRCDCCEAEKSSPSSAVSSRKPCKTCPDAHTTRPVLVSRRNWRVPHCGQRGLFAFRDGRLPCNGGRHCLDRSAMASRRTPGAATLASLLSEQAEACFVTQAALLSPAAHVHRPTPIVSGSCALCSFKSFLPCLPVCHS